MILFDTETTGLPQPWSPLSEQPKIIEFGAIKVDADYEEISRINMLIDPKMPLPEIITKITGITDADLKGQPTFAGVVDDLAEFFLGERELIAHNASFDVQLLEFELERIDMLNKFPWPRIHTCTMESAMPKFQKRMKLEKLWELATGETPHQTHRAIEDVEMMLTVCRWMRKEGML